MKHLILLLLFVTLTSTATSAQSQRWAPFEVDTVQHIARLNIQVKELSKKFLAAFAAHDLNANYAGDWQQVLELIMERKAPDLYEAGDLVFDNQDNAVEISGTAMSQLQKVIKLLKPYLASPEKLNMFLSEKPKERKEKEEKEPVEKD